MKYFLILLLLFSVSCQKTKSEQRNSYSNNIAQNIAKTKQIKAGIIRQYLPYSFKGESGQMGFDIDILQAIATDLKCSISYELIEIKDIKKSLDSGKVDLIIGVTANKSGTETVDYSIPYNSYKSSLLIASDSNVHSLEDLNSKKVAYLSGASTVSSNEITEFNAIFYKEPKKALKALKGGEVMAIKGDHTIIAALKGDEDFKMVEDVGDVNKYVFAISENQSELRDILNNSIMKFWENNTWQDIFETWFGEGSLYQNQSDFHINVIPH